MKIRTKLLLSHGLVALVVALICGLILLGLHATDVSRRSLETSYENLQAINELNSDANRMSEQIAELFTVGLEGRREVVEARENLVKKINHLEAVFDAERLKTPLEEQEEVLGLLAWIRELKEEVAALTSTGSRIYNLLAEGRREDAMILYAKRVEDQLDTRIAHLIDEALDDNARSVAVEITAWDILTERQRFLAISIVLIGAVVAVGTALLLDRQVSRPLMALADAADSLAEGRTAMALDTRRRDEMGDLAERFKEMTQRIGEQQDSLRAARDSLAEQVAERTESLSLRSEELEIANARLRELDSSRTKFLADISHELRTPLTVIRGQAEVALRGADTSAEILRAAMQAMVRKAGQMSQLVDDLLFLARSEAGAIQVIPRRVMLQEILAEVTMDASSLRASDGIRIALHQPPDPVIVEADPARLHQAAMILLDNAIGHAPPESIVTIKLSITGNEALLSISDMGAGFHEDDIPHIFDRFYRGRNNRTADRKGSGLGLPIANWIITRHRGRIEIGKPDDGSRGARVTIILPLILDHDAEELA
ncbi:MAG: ATP-binding protein [Paracoccus sp. (in: a-proteobacteria)]